MYGQRQNTIVFQMRVNGCAKCLQWLVEVKDTYKIGDQLILSGTMKQYASDAFLMETILVFVPTSNIRQKYLGNIIIV